MSFSSCSFNKPISNILVLFANKKPVQERIIDFLLSEDNIYEWQEMWLLFTLSKAKKLADAHLKVLRDIARKKENHWASRAAAIFTLGKLGDMSTAMYGAPL